MVAGGAKNDYTLYVAEFRKLHPRLTQQEAMSKASKSYQAMKKRERKEEGKSSPKNKTAKAKPKAKRGGGLRNVRSSHTPSYDEYTRGGVYVQSPQDSSFSSAYGPNGGAVVSKGRSQPVENSRSSLYSPPLGGQIPATIHLHGGAAKKKDMGLLSELLKGLTISIS